MSENKKRICFVTTTSVTLKTFVLELATMLHEQLGLDITFVCDNDEAFGKSLPSYIHYYPVSMKRGIDFSGFISLCKLFFFFRKEKFDIVQYSTPNASLYASLAAKFTGIRVRLYAQWGIRYVGFEGLKRKIFRFLERIVCGCSTVIRTTSPMNLEFSISERLYKKEKGKVLGKGGTIGVNLAEYPLERKPFWRAQIRESLNISDEFVFGFAGRISADKGGNELLSATKQCLESGLRIKLLIIGPQELDTGIDEELLAWANACEHVVFTGFIPKAKMPQYYAAMDTLVHPTYREGFGMVLQEGGAMALPMITTKIPGASEVMEDGISCHLIEPQSTGSLQSAMAQFYHNPEQVSALGIAAYQRTSEFFRREIMLDLQQKDYQTLLAKELSL